MILILATCLCTVLCVLSIVALIGFGRRDGGDFILFDYLQELIDSETNKKHHNLKHIIISHTVTLCCLLITLMAIMCHSMFYPHNIIVTTI